MGGWNGVVKRINCAECGKACYKRSHYVRHDRDQYCSESCRGSVGNKTKRTGVRVPMYKLWKRDNGICHICNEKVDFDLDFPDINSPSRDHVIPLSKGGKYSWDNVKLSHLGCNREKRDKLVLSVCVDNDNVPNGFLF
jgi:5-methylcytosine-specific restriction endonuclease McrA